jgi:hypothetical protein
MFELQEQVLSDLVTFQLWSGHWWYSDPFEVARKLFLKNIDTHQLFGIPRIFNDPTNRKRLGSINWLSFAKEHIGESHMNQLQVPSGTLIQSRSIGNETHCAETKLLLYDKFPCCRVRLTMCFWDNFYSILPFVWCWCNRFLITVVTFQLLMAARVWSTSLLMKFLGEVTTFACLCWVHLHSC